MTRLHHMDSVKPYVWTVLGIALITAIGRLITPFFSPINVALLYLLPVLLGAVYWGHRVSLFGSFLGVLTFDFFFVPPVFSFTVSNIKDLFTFGVFLLVGIVTGSMATKIRNELEKAKEREKRLEALYSVGQQIAAKADLSEMLKTLSQTLSEAVGGQVALLMPVLGHDSAMVLPTGTLARVSSTATPTRPPRRQAPRGKSKPPGVPPAGGFEVSGCKGTTERLPGTS